jgi:dUTP pyrophosphatase
MRNKALHHSYILILTLNPILNLNLSTPQPFNHFQLFQTPCTTPQTPNSPIFGAMPEVLLKIINTSTNPLPHYATEGAAGMDVRAFVAEPITLQTLERTAVPTGLFLEIPDGFEVQVRPRSGLALKQGLTCLNSPGTIDSDYRGEIKVILINLSPEPQIIQPGDRIAQLVLQKVEKASWQPVQTLTQTTRSEGGFGSTGKI